MRNLKEYATTLGKYSSPISNIITCYKLTTYTIIHTHTLNSSSAQFDHLEWLLNGTVYKTGMVRSMSLQVLIRPVTFAHAGLWECRAVPSDGNPSSSVSAGVLTVFGEYECHHTKYRAIASNGELYILLLL